jgi:UDP-N-acetylglucosamine--N-acetylmuramyl-(pentapeptide) pyrophosphoryl-undecaprenol N-acetylglucosamine transferase
MVFKSIIENECIIIAGGGTGGHLFPAMAIGEKLSLMGANVLYFGSKFGIESDIFKNKKLDYKLLNIRGIQRGLDFRSIGKNILFPFRFIMSFIVAITIIKKRKPRVVVGTGGYSSGIPLLCASILNIPTLIHEQNSYPGITTRYFSKKATKVCISYENSKKFIDSNNIILTGNPIRSSIKKIDRSIALNKMNLEQNKFTIFFMGGSQGSKPINDYLIKNYKKYLDADCQILWQCGKHSFNELKGKITHPNIHLIAFIDDMEIAYSSASLVICRSGAISISELTACGKAMILIPFPHSAGNHQLHNAQALKAKNSSIVVLQENLPTGELENIVIDLKNKPSKLLNLEENSLKLAKLNATDEIITHILEIAT